MSATICEKYAFKQRVSGQTYFKSAVGGIVDEYRLARLYKEKKLIAINKAGAKAIVDSRLACKFSIKINCCFERIMRRGDVMSEHSRGKFRLAPVVIVESIR